MFVYLLSFSVLVALLAYPFFSRRKRKAKKIKFQKKCNDTSDARYAVNEQGLLVEIHHDKLFKHSG